MPENKEQTITYDDFEQSLLHDGIDIIIPEETDEELPEGVGAAGYSPRKTAPSSTNPYYLKLGKGGYNRCILISGNSCLPNCVGYAFGRTLEIGGVTANANLPTCNAEDWFSVAKANGFKTGKQPKKGAVIVWASGNFWNGADGCGHVAVVEEVEANGSILVSQSNYGGTRFFLTNHKPPYNIFGQRFVGFIYNPYYGEPAWHKDGTGWWYERADGSYPKSEWEKVDGKWYYFNDKGYMMTGWVQLKGIWYYLESSGAMVTGWKLIDGKWYDFDENGHMMTGWINYKDKWYYCGSDGAMVVGKQTVTAYFNSNGEFQGNAK